MVHGSVSFTTQLNQGRPEKRRFHSYCQIFRLGLTPRSDYHEIWTDLQMRTWIQGVNRSRTHEPAVAMSLLPWLSRCYDHITRGVRLAKTNIKNQV